MVFTTNKNSIPEKLRELNKYDYFYLVINNKYYFEKINQKEYYFKYDKIKEKRLDNITYLINEFNNIQNNLKKFIQIDFLFYEKLPF